jgi:hypothetical protein
MLSEYDTCRHLFSGRRRPRLCVILSRPPSCNAATHLVWELQHMLIRSFLYIVRT